MASGFIQEDSREKTAVPGHRNRRRRTRMLLPTMARTSQTLTQNQTPSAMRKVAQRSPTRLMSQKKSNVLSELVKTTPA
jgi:hypothetical protein